METIHNRVSAAKEIKAKLEKRWPGVKFSVTGESFANGNSIRVEYTNGPKTKDVERITAPYEYGRFDAMTDYSYTEKTLVMTDNGEFKELGGAKYISVNRSIEFPTLGDLKERFCRDLCRLQNVEYVDENTNIFGKETWNYDQCAVNWYWRTVQETDFYNSIYDGLEIIPDNERDGYNVLSFFRIKTRPLTAQDRLQMEQIETARKEAARSKEEAKKATDNAKYAEWEAFFTAKLEKDPSVKLYAWGTNWRSTQMQAVTLRRMKEAGILKVAYVSSNGKKVYIKA